MTAADEQDKPSDVQSKDAAAAEAEPAGASSSAPRSLPTADFLTLVSMFSTQAMVALGLLNHPASGKPEPNMELAKHFIDLLGVVEEKSRGNLDAREKALLEGTLYDLRMTWVQKRTG